MIYDATQSKLNDSLWAPNFRLPNVNTLVRGVMDYSWMGDLDISEMFLNFCMHPDLKPYCGVDLKPYFEEECTQGKTLWERWDRCMMGLKSSPYVCIKGLLIALEMVREDHWDTKNPFQRGGIKLNLPGDADYNPTQPKIYRVKLEMTEIAALLVSYVDDMHTADGDEETCWKLMQHVASLLNHLGIQIAARKLHLPLQNPGPWAGSVVTTDETGVRVHAMQEKWDKVKCLINKLKATLRETSILDRKELESIRGVLIYMQQIYPVITPYVKGLHLTIDSW